MRATECAHDIGNPGRGPRTVQPDDKRPPTMALTAGSATYMSWTGCVGSTPDTTNGVNSAWAYGAGRTRSYSRAIRCHADRWLGRGSYFRVTSFTFAPG